MKKENKNKFSPEDLKKLKEFLESLEKPVDNEKEKVLKIKL